MPQWELDKVEKRLVSLEFFLHNEKNEITRFFVHFKIIKLKNKNVFKYDFSLSYLTKSAKIRIYQIEIGLIKDRRHKHTLPHEHIGDSPEGRIIGSYDWFDWSYNDVLEHFCSRVLIDFDCKPINPLNLFMD